MRTSFLGWRPGASLERNTQRDWNVLVCGALRGPPGGLRRLRCEVMALRVHAHKYPATIEGALEHLLAPVAAAN